MRERLFQKTSITSHASDGNVRDWHWQISGMLTDSFETLPREASSASLGASCPVLSATTKQSLLILGMIFLYISFQFISIHPYSHLVFLCSFSPLWNPSRFRFGACARIDSWIPDIQQRAGCFCKPLQCSEQARKQWPANYTPPSVCASVCFTFLSCTSFI